MYKIIDFEWILVLFKTYLKSRISRRLAGVDISPLVHPEDVSQDKII
jgi:hypothetical protein